MAGYMYEQFDATVRFDTFSMLKQAIVRLQHSAGSSRVSVDRCSIHPFKSHRFFVSPNQYKLASNLACPMARSNH